MPQGGRLVGLMESDINTWDGTDYYAYAWMVDFITCNTLVGYPTTDRPGSRTSSCGRSSPPTCPRSRPTA